MYFPPDYMARAYGLSACQVAPMGTESHPGSFLTSVTLIATLRRRIVYKLRVLRKKTEGDRAPSRFYHVRMAVALRYDVAPQRCVDILGH